MRIESGTIGMESARSFTASRTSYNRFVLKDYIQGGTNTGTDVAGQELGMGNMKEQTAQNQSENGEDSEKNRMLTKSGISDLRERVESMRTSRLQLRSSSANTVNSMRNYTIRSIFLLLFGEDRTRDLLKEDESFISAGNGNQGGNATLQLQPFNMKVLSFTSEECYIEQENTLFSSVGTVRTADGREISFNVDVAMSRSFTQTFQQELNLAAFQQACDPLVINFDTDTAALSDQKFLFDVDADGEEDSISMLGAGSGYLALDKNGDGTINDGSELFGPQSGNGFQDLAAYDEDGNGWIDENDSIWSKLKIWCKNPDGSDSLYSLGEKGVGAICLQNAATDFTLKGSSNQDNGYIRSTGIFLYENGNVGTVQHLDLVQ
ncbi:MAG: hypothetical protein J6B43_08485 [Lachnospiraceae bacterium]|nr:hypothetical protein [Lachnospiraceae bacterium]